MNPLCEYYDPINASSGSVLSHSCRLKAASDAAGLGLNTHLVRDAGRTQIAPGSKTVLCVGPGGCGFYVQ